MIYTIANQQLRVSVKAAGAELTSLRTLPDNTEHLWQRDPLWWNAQAPILFPIINRWPEDLYLADGRLYPMPFHGFARLLEFIPTERAVDRLTLVLAANEWTREFFPYWFELRARHWVEERRLWLEYTVANQDDRLFWFNFGLHPGFPTPGREFVLRFEQPEQFRRYARPHEQFTGELVPFGQPGQVIRAADLPLPSDEGDTVVLTGLQSRSVTLETPTRQVCVGIAGFSDLAIWPTADKPFVCVEPWFGIPNIDPTNREPHRRPGAIPLQPGGVFTATSYIEVRRS